MKRTGDWQRLSMLDGTPVHKLDPVDRKIRARLESQRYGQIFFAEKRRRDKDIADRDKARHDRVAAINAQNEEELALARERRDAKLRRTVNAVLASPVFKGAAFCFSPVSRRLKRSFSPTKLRPSASSPALITVEPAAQARGSSSGPS